MTRVMQIGDALNAIASDHNGRILIGAGPDVPADGAGGYSKGCLWIHTDGSTASTLLYVNIGTETSANFDAFANP